jgi:hypothetical protein
VQTAHRFKNHLGSVTITHPFHPKRGQKFEVLLTRTLPKGKIFVLKSSSGGTFAVPCDWTDQASPTEMPSILAIKPLLALIELMDNIKKRD